MIVTKPTYIVAEFTGDLAHWVNTIRTKYEPDIAHMPVEVTLAGSSGCGPIQLGQSIEALSPMVSPLAALFENQAVQFLGINHFPGTSIYFLEPERDLFERAHQQLLTSSIQFEPSAFAYNPHISLKGFTPPTPAEITALTAEALPAPARVSKLSIIEMAGMNPATLWSLTL